MKQKFTLAFILLMLFTQAKSQTTTTSQIDQNRNSCGDYLKLKKVIEEISGRIADDYAQDAVFITRFKKAQASWEAFRDAQLDMIFPDNDKSSYGTNYPTCRCNWLLEFSNARLDYLVKWVAHTDENESCGGSISSKKRKSYIKFND